MSLAKRLLVSPLTPAFLNLALRAYRTAMFGSFLPDHDPRLLALLRTRQPVILAAWHQDFIHTLGYLSAWNSRRKTYVLASASRDGGLATTAALAMGYQRPIRGSTSRGGLRALLAMTKLLRKEAHASMAIVCDGPRPPARELKVGIVHLARATGRPIWLVRTAFSKRVILERSWAQFHLPLPFCRAVCRSAGPFYVAPDADRDEVERIRQELEARLNALADEAEARIRVLAPKSSKQPG